MSAIGSDDLDPCDDVGVVPGGVPPAQLDTRALVLSHVARLPGVWEENEEGKVAAAALWILGSRDMAGVGCC